MDTTHPLHPRHHIGCALRGVAALDRGTVQYAETGTGLADAIEAARAVFDALMAERNRIERSSNVRRLLRMPEPIAGVSNVA